MFTAKVLCEEIIAQKSLSKENLDDYCSAFFLTIGEEYIEVY